MVLERINPNLEYIQDVLKERNLTPRQLSKMIFGESTHRDIVKEITTKPDVRASTVVKLCRALEISMDSLYKDNITSKQDVQTINGIGIINNSPHAKDDKLASYADTKRAVSRFPNCTFISFESGGHLMTGHGEEIKKAVSDFVENRTR